MSNPRFSPDTVLKDFVERAEKIGLPYMLTGSMAMIIYAIPRLTMDIDIVIELDRNGMDDFIKVFETDYYIPHEAVSRAVAQKKMFNIIHESSAFKIDCILRKDTDFQNNVFAKRKLVSYKDFEVWLISKDDLILSKLLWASDSHSELQFRDVINLMKESFDEDYVESWSRILKIDDIYFECRNKIS